jgi:methylthioribulose-1-phosphate dehydratase
MMTITDFRAEVAEIVRFLHGQGWTPATSSNVSCRPDADRPEFFISVSGLDKGCFSATNFLAIDAEGHPVGSVVSSDNGSSGADGSRRPSAETLLHRAVYRLFPKARTVLHTHSVDGVVLSLLYEREGGLNLRGFEMLKAFEGVRSHEETLRVPIFPNSQEMPTLAVEVGRTLAATSAPGFLLAGHGLYAWGETPAQAKRHVEAFEYLFDCLLKLKAHGYPLSI